MISSDYSKSIRYFTVSGISWLAVGAFGGLLNEFQLFAFFPPAYSDLGYGLLRPIVAISLIFGGILSLFLAQGFRAAEKLKGPKLDIVGIIGFYALQTALVLGILTIMGGYSDGREYGEMSFISDNLVMVTLTAFLVLYAVAAKDEKPLTTGSVLYIGTTTGMLLVYFIGNVGLPYGPVSQVAPTSGIADSMVQEVYRSGVLAFFISLPLIAVANAWVQEHYGLKIFSDSAVKFALIASTILVPVSGGGGLYLSAANGISQIIGVFAAAALSVALLGGFANAHYSLSRSGKKISSDYNGLLLRWGIFLTGFFLVVRAVTLLPFVQKFTGYTTLNPFDLVLFIWSGGIVLAVAGLQLVAQNSGKATVSDGWQSFQFYFLIIGSAVIILSAIVEGILQGVAHNAMTPEGALANTSWSSIFYATTVGEWESAAASYFLSLKGLIFTGKLMVTTGVIGAVISTSLASAGSGEEYKKPKLTEDAPVEASTAHH